MHKMSQAVVIASFFLAILAGCRTQVSQEPAVPSINDSVQIIHEDQLLGEINPTRITTVNIYEGGSTTKLVGSFKTQEQYIKLSNAVKIAQLITGPIHAIGANFEFEAIYQDDSTEQIDALLSEAGISSS